MLDKCSLQIPEGAGISQPSRVCWGGPPTLVVAEHEKAARRKPSGLEENIPSPVPGRGPDGRATPMGRRSAESPPFRGSRGPSRSSGEGEPR